MTEAYLKPCQISEDMRYIENPVIVRTFYSGIFRHISRHSAILSHVQAYCGTLRHAEAYSGIIKTYWAIFRHIQNSV